MKEELKKKIYNILKLKESGGNWEVVLDEVLCLLLDAKNKNSSYYRIYGKLSSCRYLEYKYFRSFIFDAIGELTRGGDENGIF